MLVQAEVVAAMAEPVTVTELAAVADVMQRVSARLEALRAQVQPSYTPRARSALKRRSNSPKRPASSAARISLIKFR